MAIEGIPPIEASNSNSCSPLQTFVIIFCRTLDIAEGKDYDHKGNIIHQQDLLEHLAPVVYFAMNLPLSKQPSQIDDLYNDVINNQAPKKNEIDQFIVAIESVTLSDKEITTALHALLDPQIDQGKFGNYASWQQDCTNSENWEVTLFTSISQSAPATSSFSKTFQELANEYQKCLGGDLSDTFKTLAQTIPSLIDNYPS